MSSRKRNVNVMLHDDVADWYRQLGDTVLSKGLAIAHRILTDPHLFDMDGLMLAAKRFKPEEPLIPGLRALLLPDVFGDAPPPPAATVRQLTPEQCEELIEAFREALEPYVESRAPSRDPGPPPIIARVSDPVVERRRQPMSDEEFLERAGQVNDDVRAEDAARDRPTTAPDERTDEELQQKDDSEREPLIGTVHVHKSQGRDWERASTAAPLDPALVQQVQEATPPDPDAPQPAYPSEPSF
jgi:hypothetical protein